MITERIYVTKQNEVYLKVQCSESVAMEIAEWFTFVVPGFKFMPKFRSGRWDGKIRLFNKKNRQIYVGLHEELRQRLEREGYEVHMDPDLSDTNFSVAECKAFLDSLKAKYKPKDYQLKAFITAVRKNRALFVSPTASGKSFIIYLLMQYFDDMRKLVIVPTINLVNQMQSDFIEYDLNGLMGDEIQIIKGGESKVQSRNVIISTWQSIYEEPEAWFSEIQVVVGDECHLFKADSLVGIMNKCTKTKYRYGFTGTLDGSNTNEMVLRGIFGPVVKVTTTKDLMDSGDVAKLKIKVLVLTYPDEVKKAVKGGDYKAEVDFLFSHPGRNAFIKNLALSLKGNTLVLFRNVDSHGVPLYDDLRAKSELPVYLVHGGIDGEEREGIRKIVNTHADSITVASLGTFSTGVNIPNINNIIFASPSKSRVKVLQSIGRGLRISDVKNTCTLFDIADDLSWKSWKNYTLKHLLERIKMYIAEKFEYKTYNVRIK